MDGKEERKVVYLHLLRDDVHEYYGSIACLYDYRTKEELGVSYAYLKNIAKKLTENGKSYQNEHCTIRFGRLRQKKGNRGKSEK